MEGQGNVLFFLYLMGVYPSLDVVMVSFANNKTYLLQGAALNGTIIAIKGLQSPTNSFPPTRVEKTRVQNTHAASILQTGSSFLLIAVVQMLLCQ